MHPLQRGTSRRKIDDSSGGHVGLQSLERTDVVDVVLLLRHLKDQEYKGILAIEEEEQPDDPMGLIAKSVEGMHRFITTANTIRLKSD